MTSGIIYLLTMTGSLLFVGFMIYAVFRSAKNGVECWQLISSKNAHGDERADIDKIGKVVALFLVVGVVIRYVSASDGQLTGGEMLTLLAGALVYLGGIASFSALVRARFGSPPTQEPKQ